MDPTANRAAGLPEPPSSRPVRRVLGKFEIIEEIGAGGMGRVYKARHTGLDQIVALKVLLAGEFASDEEVRRFFVEARATAQLHHPNIVAVHDVGTEEGHPYISMDHVEGQTLEARLDHSPPGVRECVEMIRQLAGALAYAHERGIVHRDIKPSNILIHASGPEAGKAQIADFGLARRLGGQSSLTRTGQIVGTLNYMSPEQAAAEPVDGRTDVYSLGAVLYECLCQERPIRDADNPLEILRLVRANHVVPLRSRNLGVHRDLETICHKALEGNCRRRYANMAEFAADLGRFLAGEPISARRSSLVYRLNRWSGRHWRGLALAALFAGSVATALAGRAVMERRRQTRLEEAKERERRDRWSEIMAAAQLGRDAPAGMVSGQLATTQELVRSYKKTYEDRRAESRRLDELMAELRFREAMVFRKQGKDLEMLASLAIVLRLAHGGELARQALLIVGERQLARFRHEKAMRILQRVNTKEASAGQRERARAGMVSVWLQAGDFDRAREQLRALSLESTSPVLDDARRVLPLFTPSTPLSIPNHAQLHQRELVIADIDGKPGNEIFLHHERGTFLFVHPTVRGLRVGERHRLVDGSPRQVIMIAADLDGDGRCEVIVGAGSTDEGYCRVSVHRYDPTERRFSTLWPRAREETAWLRGTRGALVNALAVGDVNGDGHADVVVGIGWYTRRSFVLENQGKGRFAVRVLPGIGSDESGIKSLALFDLDGDGRQEILAGMEGTHRSPESLAVFRHRGEREGYALADHRHTGLVKEITVLNLPGQIPRILLIK